MKIFVMILLGISLAFCAVDINHASKQELTSIKGIGNKKASSIILYREKNRVNLKAGSCNK